MLAETIVLSDHSTINAKLTYFGPKIDQLREIAYAVAAARHEATPLHPVNAPGTYAYQAGVAHLRLVFLPAGWTSYRQKGVEGVENKGLGLVILFQNVDHACGKQDPTPISAKGCAVTDLVDNPTAYLFPEMEEDSQRTENLNIWFYCVSCNGDEIRAELSRPREIKNGFFGTFAERIFILEENNWSPTVTETQESDEIEFDIQVTRKSTT